MSTIEITASGTGYSLRLRSRDSDVFRRLVASLKRHVPRFARRYDSTERCWCIKAEATADFREWLDRVRRDYQVSVVWEPPAGGDLK